MPNRFIFASRFSALFVAGLLVLPAPAFAGFEWVAPTEPAVVQAPMPSVQAAPSVQTYPLTPAPALPSPEISPVIIEGKAPSAVTVPLPSAPATMAPAPLTPRESEMSMHPLLPPSSVTTTTVTTTTAAPPVSSEPVVRGFAKQVPLAVALRQILPSGYGFSVDPDVDLGVLISFQGGKSWRETLADALQPAGLIMHERNQMVSIGRMGNTVTSVTTVEKSIPPVITPTASPSVAPHVLEPPSEVIAPVAAAPVPTAAASETWQASRGDSLHKVLEVWAHRANVELEWMAEYDYPLQASFNYSGYFEDAVRSLLTGFEDAHPQPIAELHSNTSLGQRVIVVQTRGNSYSD